MKTLLTLSAVLVIVTLSETTVEANYRYTARQGDKNGQTYTDLYGNCFDKRERWTIEECRRHGCPNREILCVTEYICVNGMEITVGRYREVNTFCSRTGNHIRIHRTGTYLHSSDGMKQRTAEEWNWNSYRSRWVMRVTEPSRPVN